MLVIDNKPVYPLNQFRSFQKLPIKIGMLLENDWSNLISDFQFISAGLAEASWNIQRMKMLAA